MAIRCTTQKLILERITMKNKISSGIIFALAILGGLFMFLTIYFAVTEYNDTSYTPTRDDVQVPVTIEPPVASISDTVGPAGEEAFIGGCAGEGASRSQCQCMFDYLDANLTNADFFASGDLTEEQMLRDPVFSEAIIGCL